MSELLTPIKLTDLQSAFIENLVKQKTPVAIYLKNGIKLKGTIKQFSAHTIILDHPSLQSIQQTAISTIAPLFMFQKFE